MPILSLVRSLARGGSPFHQRSVGAINFDRSGQPETRIDDDTGGSIHNMLRKLEFRAKKKSFNESLVWGLIFPVQIG